MLIVPQPVVCSPNNVFSVGFLLRRLHALAVRTLARENMVKNGWDVVFFGKTNGETHGVFSLKMGSDLKNVGIFGYIAPVRCIRRASWTVSSILPDIDL